MRSAAGGLTALMLCAGAVGCNSGFFAVQEKKEGLIEPDYYSLLQRTEREIFADKTIVRAIRHTVKEALPKAHVGAYAYNGIVLLLGSVPDFEQSRKLEADVRAIDRVKRVHNFIRINRPLSLSQRLSGSWLAIQTTFALAELPNAIQQRTKIIAQPDAVYIMGIIRPEEKHLLEDALNQQFSTRQLVLLTEVLD